MNFVCYWNKYINFFKKNTTPLLMEQVKGSYAPFFIMEQ